MGNSLGRSRMDILSLRKHRMLLENCFYNFIRHVLQLSNRCFIVSSFLLRFRQASKEGRCAEEMAKTSHTTSKKSHYAHTSSVALHLLFSEYLTKMVEADSFLHLARPLGPAIPGSQPTTAPLNVIIQPQVRPISTLPTYLET